MKKNVNVGILAHADAGKTTLTEQMLYVSGQVRQLGSVDAGTAATDSLAVEQQRGISVKTGLTALSWGESRINLIDTPGHSDFVSEVERAFDALDLAVLVISAAEGIEAQTEILLEVLDRMRLPFVVFVNKTDRLGSNVSEILAALQGLPGGRDSLCLSRVTGEGTDRVRAVSPDWDSAFQEAAVMALGDESLMEDFLNRDSAGEEDPAFLTALKQGLIRGFWRRSWVPVFCGATKFGQGISALLDFLGETGAAGSDEQETLAEAPLSAVILKAEHHKQFGKLLYLRMRSGTLTVRQALETGKGIEKIARIQKPEGRRMLDADRLLPGETGVVYGLTGVRAGDLLGPGEGRGLSSRGLLPEPTLTVRISPENPEALPRLQKAAAQLSDEDPRLNFRYLSEKKELHLSIYGEIQTEILTALLLERYGLQVNFGRPSVIYKETPKGPGEGFEAYTMPKPCWAVIRFAIEPLPPGSGLVYESVTPNSHLLYRYQEHIKTELPRALMQGLWGWEVTDLKVTLIDGQHHHIHTHPLDFFLATPLALMDGLRRVGTTVLEPINLVSFRCPAAYAGKTLGVITTHRGTLVSQEEQGGRLVIRGEIPVSECLDFPRSYPALTGGTGILSMRFARYAPCPDGLWQPREREGVNPLDRAKYILWKRGAY